MPLVCKKYIPHPGLVGAAVALSGVDRQLVLAEVSSVHDGVAAAVTVALVAEVAPVSEKRKHWST